MADKPTQYSIELDNILIRLQNSGIDLGLSGSPGDNDPVYSLKDARTDLNQLIYTQVLELIDDFAPLYQYTFREELRNKAKAKYIGGSDE